MATVTSLPQVPQWPGTAAMAAPPRTAPIREKRKVIGGFDDHQRRRRAASLRRTKDSTDELRARARRGGRAGRSSSDASRASRNDAGTQFTVANIGNNGIIYLRPVVRPGNRRNNQNNQNNQNSPTPPITTGVIATITPPDSAASNGKPPPPPLSDHDTHRSIMFDSVTATPTTSHAPPPSGTHDKSRTPKRQSTRPVGHLRSRSFSTLDERSQLPSPDPDSFRVVIERPYTTRRPKSADGEPVPRLEVSIPHYRLGTPRFSTRGTMTLRSSVYTRASGTVGTDDMRSSTFSTMDVGRLFPAPPGMTRPRTYSRSYTDAVPHSLLRRRTTGSSIVPHSSTRTSVYPIGPQLYDSLISNPDDSAVVRFSPTTGEITAATPSRLIAHITSPSFLDYELLSDFFLTFRAFLSSVDLVGYLLARLRWSVNRPDDFGRIVRVRTFVALRHWILNYFVDDFLPDLDLRVHFCDLVNALYGDLRARPDRGGGDAKIVGELKKCWRRTCAVYWDDPDSLRGDLPDQDIMPGQPFDLPSPQTGLPPPIPSAPPKALALLGQKGWKSQGWGLASAVKNRPGELAKAHHLHQQSLTSNVVSSFGPDGVPLSPASDFSMQIVSCSLPIGPLNRIEPGMEIPLYPHPVPVQDANTPKQSFAKAPTRPGHSHKRSGSFSDALRDHRAPLPLPKNTPSDTQAAPLVAVPGSLIRGAVFHPGTPYHELKSYSSSRSLRSQNSQENDSTTRSGLGNSPGVKKLLGSVRRALSGKQPGSRSSMNSGHSSDAPPLPCPLLKDLAASASSVGTTVSQSAGKGRRPRSVPQLRVDALAAKCEEKFKEAVAEQAERERREPAGILTNGAAVQREHHRGKEPMELLRAEAMRAPEINRFHSDMSSGSRSIHIGDGTQAMPETPMTPLFPALNPNTTFLHQADAEAQPAAEKEEEPIAGGTESMSVTLERTESGALPRRVSFGSSAVPKSQQFSPTSQTPILPGRAPLRHSKSHRPTQSGSSSLRRIASYHSGIKHHPGHSIGGITSSDLHTTPSDYDPFPLEHLRPARQLRRRPGGNLKAADTVHDLEYTPRPVSTGSVSNRTHSVSNSIMYSSANRSLALNDTAWSSPPTNHGTTTDGLSDSAPVLRKRLSLVDTHSSQPNLRPSFEVEVAKLAALPDDEDDGGIESALMKLEGKYEEKSPTSSRPDSMDAILPGPMSAPLPQPSHERKSPVTFHLTSNREKAYTQPNMVPPSHVAKEIGMHPLPPSARDTVRRLTVTTRSVAESDDSYSSVPLLERGLSERYSTKPRYPTSEWSRPSARPSPLDTASLARARGHPAEHGAASVESSINIVEDTVGAKGIAETEPLPPPKHDTTPRESFLFDNSPDVSDISSDISADDGRDIQSFYDDSVDTPMEKEDVFSHPLRHPPTPPATSDTLPPKQPETQFRRGLPTPGVTPTLNQSPARMPAAPTSQGDGSGMDAREHHQQPKTTASPPPPPPSHLPFILGHDSEHLAQQFTLIEKDALAEIDWKELIELRWKSSAPTGLSTWVEYLRSSPPPRGVDVVIARFNIMVKWAVSECVLTTRADERARVFTKYIHIARHARRLRNYATMYQITVALLSSDVARLHRAWDLVPAADLHTLTELEALVQPVRNFHALRVEMEGASLENGCVPFIGIYTRDLIYNAQKPALLPPPPPPAGTAPATAGAAAGADGERLVNFERHHTAATIVKSLLRLLEASSKYEFAPDPVVASRCLWMAALGDEEITAKSKQLE